MGIPSCSPLARGQEKAKTKTQKQTYMKHSQSFCPYLCFNKPTNIPQPVLNRHFILIAAHFQATATVILILSLRKFTRVTFIK